jgi:uncharacterized protein DUF2510
MGLLSKSQLPEDETSRRYLAVAPPGPRTEVLAASCMHHVRETPISATEQFGEPLTMSSLAPTSDLVRNLMSHDRDLSGWIARKSMIQLNGTCSQFMRGTVSQNFDLAFGSVGLEVGEAVSVKASLAATWSGFDVDAATALANVAIAVLNAAVSSPADPRPAGQDLYEDLYTGASGSDVESLGYDVIAWGSVVLARLVNADHVTPNLPILPPIYRDAPLMQGAGWYPNPGKYGGLVFGDAAIQRYWNGDQWTDRVRVRQGKRWETLSNSLHLRPAD